MKVSENVRVAVDFGAHTDSVIETATRLGAPAVHSLRLDELSDAAGAVLPVLSWRSIARRAPSSKLRRWSLRRVCQRDKLTSLQILWCDLQGLSGLCAVCQPDSPRSILPKSPGDREVAVA